MNGSKIFWGHFFQKLKKSLKIFLLLHFQAMFWKFSGNVPYIIRKKHYVEIQ